MINKRISPNQDDYIEKYFAEKELDLTATLDAEAAYRDADFVVIATPTNYDSVKNFFDTSGRGTSHRNRDEMQSEGDYSYQEHHPCRIYRIHPQENRQRKHPVLSGIPTRKQGFIRQPLP